MSEEERRDRMVREAKNATVAFRLKPDMREALDRYFVDHPRENQTNLMISLLETELVRLGYLPPSTQRGPDLFDNVPGSPGAVQRVADELDRLAISLARASRMLSSGP